MRGAKMKNLEQLFYSRLDIRDPNECWNWTGAVTSDGYGSLVHGRVSMRAHRLALSLRGICIPRGKVVCHECDNPRCCNPAHLFLGTQDDNMKDATQKGRMAAGTRHRCAKLTMEQVQEIRKRYIPYSRKHGAAALGREFGVDDSSICRAASSQTYAQAFAVVP